MVIKIHDCIKLLEIATCTWLTVVQTCHQHNAVETYLCCELRPNFLVLVLCTRKWKDFLRPPPFLPLHVGVASHGWLEWERLAVWAGACTQVVYSMLQCTQNEWSVNGGIQYGRRRTSCPQSLPQSCPSVHKLRSFVWVFFCQWKSHEIPWNI